MAVDRQPLLVTRAEARALQQLLHPQIYSDGQVGLTMDRGVISVHGLRPRPGGGGVGPATGGLLLVRCIRTGGSEEPPASLSYDIYYFDETVFTPDTVLCTGLWSLQPFYPDVAYQFIPWAAPWGYGLARWELIAPTDREPPAGGKLGWRAPRGRDDGQREEPTSWWWLYHVAGELPKTGNCDCPEPPDGALRGPLLAPQWRM